MSWAHYRFNNLMHIFNQNGKKISQFNRSLCFTIRDAAREETGVGITKLMYTSFLSYRRTTIHLKVRVRERVLEYDDSAKLYGITPNGRQFLELYTKMAEMLKPIT
jgi:predicted transcriptional regulator